ncbi:nucleotidase [Sulfodiicoccus acidiphilus]|uniref:Proteasome-activating nucleotidase n=1 Tax=Sulfodiicoccus acidiphilus TaxID=1670455 RepID=A0A348B1C4_9CREN|nr:proteasome-activating nucleotidase [Sulfodiicoccus acidiphilus]BBD71976.1 nucleotidase [Sulfodiicoccus acidiphilus]GGT91883.1 nucleotidase [Sulfodiicoccus acidiphilus]
MSEEVDIPNENVGEEKEQLLRVMEEKVRSLQTEVEMLRKELNYYKSEMDKLLSPPLIEATVLDTLEDGRVVVRSSSGPNLVVNALREVIVGKLKPGTPVALNQRASAIVEVLPTREEPVVRGMEVEEKPNVRYTDIGGLEEQIGQIREVVELPLTRPELFREIGVDPPKGVLLYGPPGTGKTMLAKAVATESGAAFIHVIASEFAQKFVGEGAKIVREVFELARKRAPAILFIDEIDAIASKRIDVGTSGEREIQRTLMQLLAEIDGFKPLENVRILTATNRIDVLDPALLRPGRFDRLIEVPLPDAAGREKIYSIYLGRMKVKGEVDVKGLAAESEGLSGADIKNVCVEAAYVAIREGRAYVTNQDVFKALKAVLNKREAKVKERTEKFI